MEQRPLITLPFNNLQLPNFVWTPQMCYYCIGARTLVAFVIIALESYSPSTARSGLARDLTTFMSLIKIKGSFIFSRLVLKAYKKTHSCLSLSYFLQPCLYSVGRRQFDVFFQQMRPLIELKYYCDRQMNAC
jgi:hypothetical protein